MSAPSATISDSNPPNRSSPSLSGNSQEEGSLNAAALGNATSVAPTAPPTTTATAAATAATTIVSSRDRPSASSKEESTSVSSLKAKHKRVEQRRRERLNQHFIELDALLVKTRPELTHRRRDRDSVLVNAIETLHLLLDDQQQQQQQQEQPRKKQRLSVSEESSPTGSERSLLQGSSIKPVGNHTSIRSNRGPGWRSPPSSTASAQNSPSAASAATEISPRFAPTDNNPLTPRMPTPPDACSVDKAAMSTDSSSPANPLSQTQSSSDASAMAVAAQQAAAAAAAVQMGYGYPYNNSFPSSPASAMRYYDSMTLNAMMGFPQFMPMTPANTTTAMPRSWSMPQAQWYPHAAVSKPISYPPASSMAALPR